MARPIKEGIDYFPLNVDMDQDDKVALIEAKHGIQGFAIIIKLFMKIYKEGYFYNWTEREQLLFSRKINVDINQVNDVINDALKWGLFSQQMFSDYNILTSPGIQKRYLEAVKRRKETSMIAEYVLIDIDQYTEQGFVISLINAHKNEVNVNNNPINDSNNTQRKEKKRKENKNIYPPDFDEFWEVYPRKIEKPTAYKAWKARINDGENPDDMIMAAKNYAAHCAKEKTETRYIKHPSTFIGPNVPFKDWLEPPAEQPPPDNYPYKLAIDPNDPLYREMLQGGVLGGDTS